MTSGTERAPTAMVWRIIGGVTATWGGILFAVLEVFLVPLRIDGVRAPVSLPLVVVSNIGLMLYARYVTGNRFVALLPGVGWFVVAVVASGQTAAGDTLLVGNDWMPLVLLGLGTLSVVAGAFVCAVPRNRAAGG